MQEPEIWKSIPGCEGRYEVSSIGRVKSLSRVVNCVGGTRRTPELILRPFLSVYGYHVATIYVDGKQRPTGVHRLVCAAFHGPPPMEKMHAAHNDGCKLNNHYKNLRWATLAENDADKDLHGTRPRGERAGNSRLTAKQVIEIRRRAGTPYRILAKDFGVDITTIGRIIRRDTWASV